MNIQCIVTIQSRSFTKSILLYGRSMKKEYFKISEVAKLTGITRQGLIFYDNSGIVKAAYVAENGYRYYTIEQIHQIHLIKICMEFGVSLKEIAKYVSERKSEDMLEFLTHVQEKIKQKIISSKNSLAMIKRKNIDIRKHLKIQNDDTVHFEQRRERKVLCSKPLAVHDQENMGHFKVSHAFEMELKKHGIVTLGLDTIINKELLTSDYKNEISYFCLPMPQNHVPIPSKIIMGGLYAVIYHRGEFRYSNEAYKRLLQYLDDNSYKIIGDAYESVLNNFLFEDDPENFLLEIAIPVQKKQ